MTFVYEELQLALVVPKLIQATTLLATAILIRRKSKYALNSVYFAAFLAWSISAIMDAIMYVVAPNSAFTIAFVNVGRDIGVWLLNLAWFSFLFAVLIITEGKAEALKRRNLVIAGIWYFIIVVGTMITDNMYVVDTATGDIIPPESLPPATGISFRVTALVTPISAIFISSTLVLLVVSVVLLARVFRRMTNVAERLRILMFLVGISLLLAGAVYFLVIVGFKWQTLESYWFGYLIWTFAPVFTLLGVRRSASEEAKETSEKRD